MARATFRIIPRGPYSLRASTRFLEGFAPAAYRSPPAGHLHLAFPVDLTGDSVGACIRAPGRVVVAEAFGSTDRSTVRAQISRILSLDVDGTGFPAVGRRDPVVGRLQRRYPGLRPVCFHSPYEAAVWAVVSHRIGIPQAGRIKQAMAERLGRPVDIHGDQRYAFPPPARLASLRSFPGLFGRKAEWLRAIARAAEDGAFDARRLRRLEPHSALRQLTAFPGIGEFSAQLVLVRGAGVPDFLPTAEPRLARAVAMAYGGEPPGPEALARMAESWRPYRSWVAVLLRTYLEDRTGEIGRRS